MTGTKTLSHRPLSLLLIRPFGGIGRWALNRETSFNCLFLLLLLLLLLLVDSFDSSLLSFFLSLSLSLIYVFTLLEMNRD